MSSDFGLDEAIVGRHIAAVELDSGREYLTLRFTDGAWQKYGVEGDCCSVSWIEHLTVPSGIEGAKVIGITATEAEATREQKAATDAQRGDTDVLMVYQDSIRTDRGDIVIEYRNDSNGYYGGNLHVVDESPELAS